LIFYGQNLMHVYEVIPCIYEFFPKFLLSKLIALVTPENSKMILVTSLE